MKDWFEQPHEGYWIPENAEDFLENPVCASSGERLTHGKDQSAEVAEERRHIQGRILKATWFCFAEVDGLRPWHSLENVEYVIQQGLKQHAGICGDGYIGDTGSGSPRGQLTIVYHFGRALLAETLPSRIGFNDSESSVEVIGEEPAGRHNAIGT